MQMGYIRVSSKDQNEERQVRKMLDLGIEERMIFIDKQSSKDFDRPSYQTMKRFIREGDLIYIDALDRLGRDYDGIIREWKEITRELNADIIVLENRALFDSRKFKSMGDMGKLMEDQFLSLLSFVAEQERKKIRQRQAEGKAVAKANGKRLGRPQLNLNTISEQQKKVLQDNYKRWKTQEITGVQFMKLLNLKKNTFYKILKEFENTQSTTVEAS
ncbi:recombinase family protein [Shimazuella sp. AN120528]|uniref:recombinase family protein n=1 Tax=Shimazuella soli TaxID=1892854 RepID=UPI001F0E5A70|nr:recombinase family protein [Shimazuella soli]MCH5584588.1 recombinase family protein [Shimazuella soli]